MVYRERPNQSDQLQQTTLATLAVQSQNKKIPPIQSNRQHEQRSRVHRVPGTPLQGTTNQHINQKSTHPPPLYCCQIVGPNWNCRVLLTPMSDTKMNLLVLCTTTKNHSPTTQDLTAVHTGTPLRRLYRKPVVPLKESRIVSVRRTKKRFISQ